MQLFESNTASQENAEMIGVARHKADQDRVRSSRIGLNRVIMVGIGIRAEAKAKDEM